MMNYNISVENKSQFIVEVTQCYFNMLVKASLFSIKTVIFFYHVFPLILIFPHMHQ